MCEKSKSSFASIYSQWEKSHDESAVIEKRIKKDNIVQAHTYTVNEIKKMKVQDELDLHFLTVDDSIAAVRQFIKSSHERGLKKVRVITGKGFHSPNMESVIRPAVIYEVTNNIFVREANINPKPQDGGTGAIIVVLKD